VATARRRVVGRHGDLLLRPASAWDAVAVQAFVRGLSQASRYQRFMVGLRELPADLLRQIAAEPRREALTLVAQAQERGEIVGLAQLAADAKEERAGEIAVVVADAWQRRGVASALLEALAEEALGWGWNEGYADILRENVAAIGLARRFRAELHASPNGMLLTRVRGSLRARQLDRLHARASTDQPLASH
jgi:acetyltransferase